MKSVDGKQSRFAITPRMKNELVGRRKYLIKISAEFGLWDVPSRRRNADNSRHLLAQKLGRQTNVRKSYRQTEILIRYLQAIKNVL